MTSICPPRWTSIPGWSRTARAALRAGAPIFTDAEMTAAGITRRRLPAGNEVRCLLHDRARAGARPALGHHPVGGRGFLVGQRSRGGRGGDRQRADGAVPPARADRDGRPRPAAIIGIPVGFVGSAESKIALAENPWDIPYLVVHGRRGGSALCAAAVNALAREEEI